MDPEATLQVEEPTVSTGQEIDRSSAQEPERKVVPMPTEKIREFTSEISRLREENRRLQSSTPTTAEPLAKEAETALDQIADRTTRKLSGEMESMRNAMERMELDSKMSKLQSSEHAKYLQDDIAEELGRLGRQSPSTPMNDLLDQAEKNATYAAVTSGKYARLIAEQAAREVRTEAADRSKAGSGSTKAATARTDEAPDFDTMTPQQIADSGRFEEYFASQMGRKPRF